MSTFKGMLGEAVVNVGTWLMLDKEIYHRINNVTLPLVDGGSTQIDHIIVSKFGIFVIETKNYKGWIFGNEKQRQWTQVIHGKKYKFQNPLRQNYLHIKTLSELLELDMSYFHSMIAFIGECELKTRDELPEHVLKGGISSYIKNKQSLLLTEDQVQAIVESIKTQRFAKSWRTNANHKAYLKDKHNQPKPVASNPIAPKSTEPKLINPILTASKLTDTRPATHEIVSQPQVFITPFDIDESVDNQSNEGSANNERHSKDSSLTDSANGSIVEPSTASVSSESVSSKSVTNPDIAPTESDTPICPKCDSLMIKRVAKSGSRQGQAFWGCSNFPKCRSVININ